MSKKEIKGTKEWSVQSINICKGCKHACRYCYARYNAVDRFKQVESDKKWRTMVLNEKAMKKKYKKYDGRVMFPTTHDIVPKFIEESIITLRKLLEAGNDVLIVSKPNIESIKRICHEFQEYRDKILFRFSIGARNPDILWYWEPFAPEYEERKECLRGVWSLRFNTSVSMEPLLDYEDFYEMYMELSPYVTDAIWVGKLNNIDSRVKIVDDLDKVMVRYIKEMQTDENIKEFYRKYNTFPKLKWKESVKKIVGLELADKVGLDI